MLSTGKDCEQTCATFLFPRERRDAVCLCCYTKRVRNSLPYHTMALHDAIQYYMIRYTIPHHTIPYHTISYRTIPYHTIRYDTIRYDTIPYYTIPYRIIPHHIISYHNHTATRYLWEKAPQPCCLFAAMNKLKMNKLRGDQGRTTTTLIYDLYI